MANTVTQLLARFRGSLRALRQRLSLTLLAEACWGYDFFVSYSHADNSEYPKNLATRLQAEPHAFRVHLDTEEYHGGDDLAFLTWIRAQTTRKLVVIAKDKALTQSRWVRREVDAFMAVEKHPVLIDFPLTAKVANGPAQPDQTLLQWIETNPDVLRIPEPDNTHDPTSAVFQAIVDSFEGTRVARRRRILVLGVISVLTTLFLAAVALAIVAEDNRQQAVAESEKLRDQLIRADARQAETHLAAGRTDAAIAFLSRGLSFGNLPVATLVGHMTPATFFAPTRRVQLDEIAGSIDRVWADDTGRFVAVKTSDNKDQVSVFDLRGDIPRLVHEQALTAFDPVFAVVSKPRPAVISFQWPGLLTSPKNAPPALVAHWLDDSVAPTARAEGLYSSGYTSFVRLSDGTFLFSQGASVNRVRLTETGFDVRELPTKLQGQVNRITAAERGSCFLLSDYSTRFELHHIDGRAPVIWNARTAFESAENINLHHLQGVVDRTCSMAALWSDGGDATIYLVRLRDQDGAFAPSRIADLDSDGEDELSFKNRYFSNDGQQFIYRRGGLWIAYNIEANRARSELDAGQPDSKGVLSDGGTLIMSGFDETVRYGHPNNPETRRGMITVGRSPHVLLLSDADDKKDSAKVMTVSASGLITYLAEPPASQRYEIFIERAYLGLSRLPAVLSPSGNSLLRYHTPAGDQMLVEVQKVLDGAEVLQTGCKHAIAFDAHETERTLTIFAAQYDGTICRISHNGQPDGQVALKVFEKRPNFQPDLVHAISPKRIFAVDKNASEAYLMTIIKKRLTWSKVKIPGDGQILDVAFSSSRGRLFLRESEAVFDNHGHVQTVPLTEGRCERIFGFSDHRAVVQCDGTLIDIARDGTTEPIMLPENANVLGSALSPDGSTLLAPLADSKNRARKLYAVLLDRNVSFVFEPAILTEPVLGDRDDSQTLNRLPQIEEVHYSRDGQRVFLRLRVNTLDRLWVSNGALTRFQDGTLAAQTGLRVSDDPAHADLVYRMGELE